MQKMKKTYLLLTVIGFVLPNYFVLKESLDSGNILLWRDIPATFSGMFANNISSAFMMDLLFVVALFLFWSLQESRRLGIKQVWRFWLFTFLFGIASGLPLFLYFRALKLEEDTHSPQGSVYEISGQS
jgi:dolichyl-phosphate-mannose--protein O-mannosyl transferase